MLELRPICENCAAPLPPAATNAMICSFECTFCRDCAVDVLGDVCPNCGGGFSARPIRPQTNWHDDTYLGTFPAVVERRHEPVDVVAHAALAARIGSLAPHER